MRELSVPHATTCVALRYDNGVVMAGDRRATAGNLISHRTMEKVVQADRHSGVAIAGTAGPAIEMIRLFQLQLEHYEKVEGSTLSLEGKANQLSTMVRANLPAAMQGMVVVPIFAGYDVRRGTGRLWDYDATGGRYEERDYVATGSGACTPAPSSRSAGDRRSTATQPSTSPPGAVGGRRQRFGHRWPRHAPRDLSDRRHDRRATVGNASVTTSSPALRRHHRRGELAMSMPFYVAPEQMMKDRADYARKGIARGRALVAVRFVDGIVIVAENPSDTLRKVSEIYDRIAFAGVGKYNEFDQLRVAGVRAADLKGYQYSRDDVDARSLANSYAQMLGNIFTHEMKPMEVEILVAEVGLEPAGDQMFHILYDGTVVDARTSPRSVATPRRSRAGSPRRGPRGSTERRRSASGAAAIAGADREIPADDLEVAELSRNNGRRCFHRLPTDALDCRARPERRTIAPWSPSISTATSGNRSAPGASATTTRCSRS